MFQELFSLFKRKNLKIIRFQIGTMLFIIFFVRYVFIVNIYLDSFKFLSITHHQCIWFFNFQFRSIVTRSRVYRIYLFTFVTKRITVVVKILTWKYSRGNLIRYICGEQILKYSWLLQYIADKLEKKMDSHAILEVASRVASNWLE